MSPPPDGSPLRALRYAAALPIYLLFALALTIAATLLAGISWLAFDAWGFALLALGLIHLNAAPPIEADDELAERARRRRRTLSALAVGAAAAFVAILRRDEVGWLIAALGATVLVVWSSRFRRSVMGPAGGIPTREVAMWIAVFLGFAWFVDGVSIVVVLVLLLVRQVPVFAALARGRMRPLALAVALAIVGLALLPFRRSFEAEPTPCRPVGEEIDFRDPEARWIVLLGDSSTEGIFLPERLTYAGALQRRLADAPGPRYRVANCAFSGARSDQAAEQLRKGLEFSPEVVTIFIGDNDTMLDASRTEPAVIDRWSGRVRELIATTRAAGARPVLVTALNGLAIEGDFVRWLHEGTLDLAREQGVEVVDPQTVAAERSVVPFYVIADFVHPNQLGHALVAELIADVVRRPAPER